MPHQVDVKCPGCGGHAAFEFAEVVRIGKKDDVPLFLDSDQFEYRQFQDSCGHYWHAALYFAGLHGSPERALSELPEGYQASDWQHSRFYSRSHGLDLGSVSCGHCARRAVHQLRWPQDAHYVVAYKGKELWAFNRDSALELRDYLASGSRDLARYRWRAFLLHVPSLFKSRKARGELCKRFDRLLRVR